MTTKLQMAKARVRRIKDLEVAVRNMPRALSETARDLICNAALSLEEAAQYESVEIEKDQT